MQQLGLQRKGMDQCILNISKNFVGYSPKDIYPYAPPEGKKALRQAWKDKIVKENPSLQEKNFGLPIVTNALTHGLSIAADLFVDEGIQLSCLISFGEITICIQFDAAAR